MPVWISDTFSGNFSPSLREKCPKSKLEVALTQAKAFAYVILYIKDLLYMKQSWLASLDFGHLGPLSCMKTEQDQSVRNPHLGMSP